MVRGAGVEVAVWAAGGALRCTPVEAAVVWGICVRVPPPQHLLSTETYVLPAGGERGLSGECDREGKL